MLTPIHRNHYYDYDVTHQVGFVHRMDSDKRCSHLYKVKTCKNSLPNNTAE